MSAIYLLSICYLSAIYLLSICYLSAIYFPHPLGIFNIRVFELTTNSCSLVDVSRLRILENECKRLHYELSRRHALRDDAPTHPEAVPFVAELVEDVELEVQVVRRLRS